VTTSESDDAEVAREDAGFMPGMAMGFALAAVLIHVALTAIGNWQALYQEYSKPLPVLTRLTISTAWRFGVPLVGGAAIAVLILRRPKPLALYYGLAIVLALAAAMTWWFPSQPIYELAGNIK
jgi:hypothetical protein